MAMLAAQQALWSHRAMTQRCTVVHMVYPVIANNQHVVSVLFEQLVNFGAAPWL